MMKKFAGIFFGVALLALPALVSAEVTLPGGPSRAGGSVTLPGGPSSGGGGSQPTISNPLGNIDSVAELVKKLLDVIIQIGLVVIVVVFIWAGFKYILAFGDEKEVEKAHKMFLYTVLGTAILLGSKVIVTVIEETVKALGN